MRYDFSAQFLRILPPDTTFGDAWESLCEMLLRKELGIKNIMRLRPPDRGVDILCRSENTAFQCKSTERGTFGTIDAEDSAQSLETAIKHKHTLDWIKYCFATNAEYTGAGYEKIILRAKEMALCPRDIEFLGPAYWDHLCTVYSDLVKDRFDYRVTVDEKHLLEVFQQGTSGINIGDISSRSEKSDESIIITNNLSEVELEIPLLGNLLVETQFNAILELFGLTEILKSNSHIGIVLKPLFSLRFQEQELSFLVRLRDLNIQSGDRLELYVKLDLVELAAYDKIIQLDPTNVTAMIGRAEVLKSHGRLDDALSSYEDIISKHPDNVLAKTGRAEVLRSTGRLNEALQAYDATIAEHPEAIVAKNGRAETLKNMGRFAEALNAYDPSVEQLSDNSGKSDNWKEGPEQDRSEGHNTSESKQGLSVAYLESFLQNTMWKAVKRLPFLTRPKQNNNLEMFALYRTEFHESSPSQRTE